LTIWENQHLLTILRYESFVAEPIRAVAETIRRIAPDRGDYHPRVEVEVRPPQEEAPLDAWEQDVIDEICGDVAARFGYS
jgi:hypothetical protein